MKHQGEVGVGALAGGGQVGPNQNNFTPLENELKDEGFASNWSKMVRPWEGVTVQRPGGKGMKKGENPWGSKPSSSSRSRDGGLAGRADPKNGNIL